MRFAVHSGSGAARDGGRVAFEELVELSRGCRERRGLVVGDVLGICGTLHRTVQKASNDAAPGEDGHAEGT